MNKILYRAILTIVFVVAFSTTSIADHAQMLCQTQAQDRNITVNRLANKYKESEVATGVITEKVIVELLAKTDGSSWSSLLTGVDGLSCLFASGQNLIAGDLGKMSKYYSIDKDYPNMVAFGLLNGGRMLVIIANDSSGWKMLSFDSSGIGYPITQGEDWRTKTIPIDPEA